MNSAQGTTWSRLNTTPMGHFLENAANYWGAMLIVGILNLSFSVIAARHLGPTRYGVLAAVVTMINVFLIAATALTRTVTAHVATSDDRPAAAWFLRRSTARAAFAGAVAMAAFGLAATPVANLLRISPAWIWLAGASLIPALAGGVTTGILQGMRLFLTSGVVNLSASVLKLLTLILLLDAGLGVVGASVATLVEVTVISIVGIAVLGRILAAVPARQPAHPIAERQRLASLPTALTVARLVFFNLDILVARHFLGPEAAGLFAALAVTGRIIAYGTGALPQVVYPYLVRYRKDPALTARYLVFCLLATLLIGGGAIAVLTIAPAGVVGLLFGSSFRAISPYVAWYGLAFLLYSLAYVILHYLLALESWWVWVYAVAGGIAEVAAMAVFHHGIGDLTAVEVVFFACLFLLTSLQAALAFRRERNMVTAMRA